MAKESKKQRPSNSDAAIILRLTKENETLKAALERAGNVWRLQLAPEVVRAVMGRTVGDARSLSETHLNDIYNLTDQLVKKFLGK